MTDPYHAPRAELVEPSATAGMAVREIRFSWTRADIFLGCLIAFYRRPVFMVMALIPGILVVRDEYLGHFGDLTVPQIAVVAFSYVLAPAALLWAFSLLVGCCLTAFRPGKLPGILGEHLIRIGPDGIHEETSVNSGAFGWSAVRFVRRSVFGVFVQLAGASFLVPRRYFRDGGEVLEVVRLANSYLASTRGA